jgi:hypothetical protein
MVCSACRRRPIVFALALSALAAWVPPAARGQVAPEPRFDLSTSQFPRGAKDPMNAALLYYKAWLDPVFDELSKPCGEASPADPAWKPDAAVTKLLAEHQGYIAMLLRATEAPRADFGIEWSQGIYATLPHLSKMRGSARILACDARRCLAEGKLDDAADRAAAIYRMADHIGHDGVLISALVSVAIGSLADTQAEALMNGGGLTIHGKQQVLVEVRRMARPDAFGMKEAIEGEKRWTVEWLKGVCKGPDAGKMIAEQVMMLSGRDEPEEVIEQVRKMSEAEVRADLDKTGQFYTDVLATWDRPDAADQLKPIEERLANGDYGLIGKSLVPAVSKAMSSDVKIRTRHAAVLTRLEGHAALAR